MGPDNEQKKIIAKLKQSNNKINKAKKDWERKVSMPLLNRIPDKKLAATLKSQTSLKLD